MQSLSFQCMSSSVGLPFPVYRLFASEWTRSLMCPYVNCSLSPLQFIILYVKPSFPACSFVLVGLNNNNNHYSVYGAIVMTRVIARVHLVHLMNADRALGGRQPSDQASQLGL